MEGKWKQSVRRKMLAWFARNARDLPWRRTKAPYHVWISEIMLQQTQVVAVIPYFDRFIAKFPTIESLAKAKEEEVLRLWEGLGYYRRARQLHKAAAVIWSEHRGEFPSHHENILALPGVGRYTAGAIRSIAFDQPAAILEANTLRVFSRLTGFAGDTTSTRGQRVLWEAAEKLLPRKRPGEFNQAMMELGSEVCTPRDPTCEACPLRLLCPTRAHGLQDRIPAPKKKTKYEDVFEVCVVVSKKNQVLLRRCAEGERWAGLWDFPRFAIEPRSGPSFQKELAESVQRLTGISAHVCERWKTIKHGVTRFRITLDCHKAYFHSGRRRSDSRWVTRGELAELPLSTTGRQVADGLSG
ncbi:MAG: A/G-specific adenine glycosylase [Planctomycetaceae bacterium]|nr:A/G-specific adenine glycosylase [Planctomycetaceae bacterium]